MTLVWWGRRGLPVGPLEDVLLQYAAGGGGASVTAAGQGQASAAAAAQHTARPGRPGSESEAGQPFGTTGMRRKMDAALGLLMDQDVGRTWATLLLASQHVQHTAARAAYGGGGGGHAALALVAASSTEVSSEAQELPAAAGFGMLGHAAVLAACARGERPLLLAFSPPFYVVRKKPLAPWPLGAATRGL